VDYCWVVASGREADNCAIVVFGLKQVGTHREVASFSEHLLVELFYPAQLALSLVEFFLQFNYVLLLGFFVVPYFFHQLGVGFKVTDPFGGSCHCTLVP
jgi:hypothetical protein